MEKNTSSAPKPRLDTDELGIWLDWQRENPDRLLGSMTYLYCVDGCRPDEVTQRFAMVEAAAQKVGIQPERIAQWHKLFGDLWEDDPDVFRDGVYQIERSNLAKPTVLQLMSEVIPHKAEYLIAPYLPKGMLTVLGGVSGVGKTWLALYWAAQVSRRFRVDEPGAVYYFTQENDPCIVLQPRLQALGAELSRVAIQKFTTDSPTLTLDDERLEMAAHVIPPRLVIFDPIQSYLGAGVEMNKANEVRPILDWLGRFAQRYNCAVVLVSHMAKPGANNSDALDRLLGSSDFRNAARSIIIVGRDPAEPEVRVFAHAKNSIGQPGASQRYRVSNRGVEMLGECELDYNEIIRVGGKPAGRPATSLNVAVEALRALLEPKGWATYEEIERMRKENGISKRTLSRAAEELCLKHVRAGRAGTRQDWWLLPTTSQQMVCG